VRDQEESSQVLDRVALAPVAQDRRGLQVVDPAAADRQGSQVVDPVAADRQGSQVVDPVDPLAPGLPTSEDPGRKTSARREVSGLAVGPARARAAAEVARTRRTVPIRSISERSFDLDAQPHGAQQRRPPGSPAVGATLVVARDQSQSQNHH
jgi:hypothetical protein